MSSRMFALTCLFAISGAFWVLFHYYGVLAIALALAVVALTYFLGVMHGLSHKVIMLEPQPVLAPLTHIDVAIPYGAKNVVLFPGEYRRH